MEQLNVYVIAKRDYVNANQMYLEELAINVFMVITILNLDSVVPVVIVMPLAAMMAGVIK